MDGRLGTLETEVREIKTDISDLKESQSELRTSVDTLTESVDTLTEDHAETRSSVNAILDWTDTVSAVVPIVPKIS